MNKPLNPYVQASFLQSAAKVSQLPEDSGIEIAFAGRSNAGKSSALNCLTNQRQLARTSKTPGRTQLINLFTLDDQRRLVDLPGYGYAKVAMAVKAQWQKHLAHYLEVRKSLKGLVLVMDIRHPCKDQDTTMLNWAIKAGIAVHILLTKADKLSKSSQNSAVFTIERQYRDLVEAKLLSVQTFSSLNRQGVEVLVSRLNDWYEWKNE